LIKLSTDWIDYECIDSGDGEKIERYKDIILRRPDPTSIWKIDNTKKYNCHAIYHRSSNGGGSWEYLKKMPLSWTINYKDLTFKIAPTGFKHTGIFPEQATNWDYIIEKIKNFNGDVKVLNLFAYTGGATLASSYAGAKEVVHVDASKGINEWAKENVKLSNLENNYIRFIQDDCLKFIEKEKRRGRKYEAIIMDPPSYGRGPNGEVWKLENNLSTLLNSVKEILSDDFCFVLINCYTTGISPTSLSNILKTTFKNVKIETGEIGLPITNKNLALPCGIYGKVEKI